MSQMNTECIFSYIWTWRAPRVRTSLKSQITAWQKHVDQKLNNMSSVCGWMSLQLLSLLLIVILRPADPEDPHSTFKDTTRTVSETSFGLVVPQTRMSSVWTGTRFCCCVCFGLSRRVGPPSHSDETRRTESLRQISVIALSRVSSRDESHRWHALVTSLIWCPRPPTYLLSSGSKVAGRRRVGALCALKWVECF